jgi:hypothetical protein
MTFSSVNDVFDEARGWPYRVTRASIGTTTGLIVLAMLAKEPKVGPAFGQTCEILLDGKVTTPVRRNGVWGRREVIGTTISVRDNMRELADHCKLSDADRTAMFAELQRWIKRDMRAKSEI